MIYMHTAHSGHILIHIARSIPCVFGKSSRDISLNFVFITTLSYGVIIPGNYSEIHWRMAIDLIIQQAKFHMPVEKSYVHCPIEGAPQGWYP